MKPDLEAVSGGTQEGLEASAAPPRSHDLKCWPDYFRDVRTGIKPFELRSNDRDFRVGDVLRLREWSLAIECYTGEEERRTIGYILRGPRLGLAEGWVILGFVQGNAAPKETPSSPDSPSQGERKQQLLDQDRAAPPRSLTDAAAEIVLAMEEEVQDEESFSLGSMLFELASRIRALSDKPPARPSASSSASLESGGGPLDKMGAATREPTTPEGR